MAPESIKPVILLDIDDVINIFGYKPDETIWRKWERGSAYAHGRAWGLLWAPALIDAITEIHTAGLAEIRWHTTWQHEALNFGAEVGLPDFPIQEARVHGGQPWWKIAAAERVLAAEGRALVWLDDQINGFHLGEHFNSYIHHDFGGVPNLLAIAPRPHQGLTPRHMAQVTERLTAWRDHGTR